MPADQAISEKREELSLSQTNTNKWQVNQALSVQKMSARKMGQLQRLQQLMMLRADALAAASAIGS